MRWHFTKESTRGRDGRVVNLIWQVFLQIGRLLNRESAQYQLSITREELAINLVPGTFQFSAMRRILP